MIQYATFPRTWSPPPWVERIVEAFLHHQSGISPDRPEGRLSSEEVLAVLAGELEALGFHIEKVALADRRMPLRTLSAGKPAEQHYHVDVYHPEWHCCLAIEDGPAWTSDAIDEDGVEPMLVANADTLCLAVPGGTGSLAAGDRFAESEYDRALALAQVVYSRSRPYLPHRLVLIGY